MKALLLFSLGVATGMGPVVLFLLETHGKGDEADFSHWLTGKTLEQMQAMQGMVLTGPLMIFASAIV